MDEKTIKDIARQMVKDGKIVALTGAGISTESGIPDFRSSGGLWEKYPPDQYATIEAFLENPEKTWQMLKEMQLLLEKAVPNPAHVALARLEQLGLLSGIITQNVDGLHERAGSKEVVCFHGSADVLCCMRCLRSINASEARKQWDRSFPQSVNNAGKS